MTNNRAILEKACALDTFAMEYETAVYALRAGDYLADFYDTFRVRKNRSCRLIPHPEPPGPKTGDPDSPRLWLIVLLVSAEAFLILQSLRRKNMIR